MRPPINTGLDLEQLLRLRAARRDAAPADRIQLSGLAPGVGVSSLLQPGGENLLPEVQARQAAEQELRRRQLAELLMVRPQLEPMLAEAEPELRSDALRHRGGDGTSVAVEAERRRGASATSHAQGRMRRRRRR